VPAKDSQPAARFWELLPLYVTVQWQKKNGTAVDFRNLSVTFSVVLSSPIIYVLGFVVFICKLTRLFFYCKFRNNWANKKILISELEFFMESLKYNFCNEKIVLRFSKGRTIIYGSAVTNTVYLSGSSDQVMFASTFFHYDDRYHVKPAAPYTQYSSYFVF
jgi:hypothetical protein